MLTRILCALGLLLLPVDALCQGPLLWEVQEDLHGADDTARAVTLSGKVAVVVGNTQVPQDGVDDRNMAVLALRRKTGAVEWADESPLGFCCQEFVTSRQKIAYTAATNWIGTRAFVVRAYDVSNGAVLWENTWTAAPDSVNALTDIVVGPTAVVVVGYGESPTGTLVMLIRALEPLTGDVLWDDRVGADGTDFIAWTAAINRNRVFIAGNVFPAGALDLSARSLLLRAYDVQSGGLDWEVIQPTVTPTNLELAAGRLFVAGLSATTSFSTYLGAFSARTGAPLWENPYPQPGSFRDIAVKGSRLVGTLMNSPVAVQSYNVTTGTLEWQDPAPAIRGFAVGLNDDAVFVAGVAFNPSPLVTSELMVRAYEAGTGQLLWDDRSHPSTDPFVDRVLMDLAVGKWRLFVVGYTKDQDSSEDADFVIRAYDIRPDVQTP